MRDRWGGCLDVVMGGVGSGGLGAGNFKGMPPAALVVVCGLGGRHQSTHRQEQEQERKIRRVYIIFQISTAEWGFYSVCLRGGCVS